MDRITSGVFNQFLGIKIIENDFIDSHSDFSLKGFSKHYRSKLTGLEKWLTLKLGFDVEIFTIIQKEYLKDKRAPNVLKMNDSFICNKEGLIAISDVVKLNQVS